MAPDAVREKFLSFSLFKKKKTVCTLIVIFWKLFLFLVLWKKLIQKQGGVITAALDLSSLAKLSDGYTPGHMVQVIQSVVTKQRISQQETKPLTAAEFVAPLAKIDPIFQEEEEAFKVRGHLKDTGCRLY